MVLYKLPMDICFADPNGRIILCNNRMRRLSFALCGHELQIKIDMENALSVPDSIMVGVLMVAIAVYVCVGLPNMNPGQLALADMFSSGTKLTTLGAGIAVLSSSLSGGTSISQIADDVKDPRRNIPLAILLAPVVVAVIYILMAVVTLGAMPEGQLTTLSEVAKGFLPPARRLAC